MARFHLPATVAVDSAGDIYVADTANSTIRKVTSAGTVTTLAGSSQQPGAQDGTNGSARFNQPWGLAVDNSGNVWVADTFNDTVRRITPAGVVTTIAGTTNTASFHNGPSLPNFSGGALFNTPYGIAVDATGNVFVADTFNNMIRKISADSVTTLAGSGIYGSRNGTGGGAQFSYPIALAVDGAGNIYVAEYGSGLVRCVTAMGAVTTVAGITFSTPGGIAVDSATNLYVADTGNQVIRKLLVDSTGTNWIPTILAGYPGIFGDADGIGEGARFYDPEGVAVDSAGNVYVGDSVNNMIREISASSDRVTTLAGPDGSYGSADGLAVAARFDEPFGVAVDSATNLYAADTFNNTIRRLTPNGSVTTLAGLAGFSGAADGSNNLSRFNEPTGLGVDAAGNLYVVDYGNSTIRKITPDLLHSNWVTITLCGKAGQPGFLDANGTNALFRNPYAVAVDSATNVYVTDSRNHAIRRVSPAGAVSTYAGDPGVAGYRDATGTNALFNLPIGVAVDSATNVYVADSGNDVIRRIGPGGIVTTLAGAAGVQGTRDGSQALFNAPEGIAADPFGNIYVADTASDTLRVVTAAGMVTTVGGKPGLPGSADGLGAVAQFDSPAALAVDSSGAVYIADAFNNTLRKGTVYQALPVALLVTGLSGGNYQFSFPTVAGETYSIQQSSDVASGIWTSSTNLTGVGSPFQFTAPLSNAQQFFRVVQP